MTSLRIQSLMVATSSSQLQDRSAFLVHLSSSDDAIGAQSCDLVVAHPELGQHRVRVCARIRLPATGWPRARQSGPGAAAESGDRA